MRSTRQRTMWAQRCRPCRQPAALSQGWPRKMCVPGPSHGTSLKSLQCTLATIALCKKLLRAWKLPYPFLSTQLCTPTMIPTDNAVDPHRCDLAQMQCMRPILPTASVECEPCVVFVAGLGSRAEAARAPGHHPAAPAGPQICEPPATWERGLARWELQRPVTVPAHSILMPTRTTSTSSILMNPHWSTNDMLFCMDAWMNQQLPWS